jgi:cytidylate kinase
MAAGGGGSGSQPRLPVITMDGPAGAGKSSVARRLAAALGFRYVDTGAMYRAVALAAVERGLPLEDPDRLVALVRRLDLRLEGSDPVHVFLDGREVTDAIRTPAVSEAAAQIATLAPVRALLVDRQRQLAATGGVVLEGRDTGTVVWPQAELKVFLTASATVRAERRQQELAARGEPLEDERVLEQLRERDRRDAQRAASPLVPAEDAVVVDTTALELDEVVRLLLLLVREQLPRGR